MVLPLKAGSLAMRQATEIAAPQEIPESRAFFARQAPGVLDGLVVAGRLDAVDQREVDNVGDEARADALDAVMAGLQRFAGEFLRDDGAVGGLDADGDERFLEVPA